MSAAKAMQGHGEIEGVPEPSDADYQLIQDGLEILDRMDKTPCPTRCPDHPDLVKVHKGTYKLSHSILYQLKGIHLDVAQIMDAQRAAKERDERRRNWASIIVGLVSAIVVALITKLV